MPGLIVALICVRGRLAWTSWLVTAPRPPTLLARSPTPNPSGGHNVELRDVSCWSTTACTAVGYYQNSSQLYQMVAERWNGHTWTSQPTPQPSGSPSAFLLWVSCSSATACTAVGLYGYDSSGNVLATLAESTS
jgi:hypothetical protein